jgi:hypothetical protein
MTWSEYTFDVPVWVERLASAGVLTVAVMAVAVGVILFRRAGRRKGPPPLPRP